MEKTREELQLEINAMTLQTEKNWNDQQALAKELVKAKQQLADVNKPTISQEHYELLCDNITDKISEFDWDEIGNYEIDFGIDYENRIAAENISFQNVDELQRLVEEAVEQSFKTIE